MPDVTNRFISMETFISAIVLTGGGFLAYAQLSAQVAQKVDRTDQVVVATKVEMIEEDVIEIKVTLNKHIKESHEREVAQIRLLQKILDKVEDDQ